MEKEDRQLEEDLLGDEKEIAEHIMLGGSWKK